MTSISLAIITFNEKQNIIPLLNNVCDIFDEIVIVDGCSTDGTIALIEQYQLKQGDNKVKLYLHPQKGERYSKHWNQPAQRNLALARCTKPWVFALDADERLDINTRLNLEELIKSNYEAFAMPTYHYWEKEMQIREDWSPDYHYRFWKNNNSVQYSSPRRHCTPLIKGYPDVRRIRGVQNRLPYTDIVIHHYHHVPISMRGNVYRTCYQDVKTLTELVVDMKIKEVPLRKKGRKEQYNERGMV